MALNKYLLALSFTFRGTFNLLSSMIYPNQCPCRVFNQRTSVNESEHDSHAVVVVTCCCEPYCCLTKDNNSCCATVLLCALNIRSVLLSAMSISLYIPLFGSLAGSCIRPCLTHGLPLFLSPLLLLNVPRPLLLQRIIPRTTFKSH